MGCRHRNLLFALLALTGCDKIFDLRDVAAFDGPPGPDVPDAYLPEHGCSSTSLIDEEFDEAGSPVWFPLLAATADANLPTLTAGAAHIDMGATGYATLSTVRYYDLRDDRLTVELTLDDTDMSNAIEVRIVPATATDGRTELEVMHQGTDLVVLKWENGVSSELWRMPYDATLYRFLRFANVGDSTTVSTSATGGDDFVVRSSTTGGPWGGFVKLEVFATRGGAAFTADVWSVHGGTSMVGACPARELRDDFEGITSLGPQWARTQTYDGMLVVQNGAVEMSYVPDGTTYANVDLIPATIYDLREGSFAIEVPDMVDPATGEIFELGIETLSGTSASFMEQNGALSALKNSTKVAMVPYDAVLHRWMRFREAGGTLYWEVSPDGVGYVQLGQATELHGFETVDVSVGISGTATQARTARITNFNTP